MQEEIDETRRQLAEAERSGDECTSAALIQAMQTMTSQMAVMQSQATEMHRDVRSGNEAIFVSVGDRSSLDPCQQLLQAW
eukprot:SAG11_NODE_334_length_10569_cov_9.662082_7_plen_80_part_00